jgi:tetratricopeptide (TPR) repeat protein
MFLEHQIRRDDPRLTVMYRHFQRNLDDIIRAARRSGAEVLLCTPASNLRESAPFASLHSPALSEQKRAEWEKLVGLGAAAEFNGQFESAAEFYRSAMDLDSHHAELQFRAGHSWLRLQKPRDALRSFELARDLDTLRFRTDGRLLELIEQASRRWQGHGVFFCDTRSELGLHSKVGIPGQDLFFDHVHLTFPGNYLLARSIAEQTGRLLPESWRASDRGGWLSREICAERLALTDWDQYQIHEVMQRRLREPPFSTQLNSRDREQRFSEELSTLRAALTPENIEAAAAVYRKAVERSPSDALLRLNFGKLLAAAGKDLDALSQFQRVTRLWPQHAAAYQNAGLLLHKQGNIAEAEKHFLLALEERPGLADAHNSLGLVRAAEGDFHRAIASYRRALVSNPELLEARANLAQALREQNNLREAEEQYHQALRRNPQFVPALWGLAELRLEEGRIFEAIPHLADAARLQPEQSLARSANSLRSQPSDPVQHFKIANVLAALHKTNEAMASLQSAVKLDTNFWEARYLLGVELATQNRLAEAQEQFYAVTTLRPDYARGHLNLGVALARQSQFDAAAAHFREALRLEPTNRSAQQFLQNVEVMSNSSTETGSAPARPTPRDHRVPTQ